MTMDTLRRNVWPLASVTLLAAALRFPTLDTQSFWSDEAVTALLVRLNFQDMLATIPKTESTPPLYYMVAWIWAQAFGSDEIALRSLSALAGVATAPLAYGAAATLLSRRAAVAASVLVAVNPLLVWYSQEARSFALLVPIAALSFLLFARAIENPTRGALAGWSVVSALAVSTHYFAAFVVGAEAMWLLFTHRTRAIRFAVAVPVVVGTALIPLALVQRGNGGADWIADSRLGPRIFTLAKQFLIGLDAPLDRLAAFAAGLLLLTALAILVARGSPRAQRGAMLAAGVGLPALAFSLALSLLGHDYFNTANGVASLVPLAVAASAGFAVPTARRVGALVLALLCALSIGLIAGVALDPAYHRGDWRGAAGALGSTGPARIVVLEPDYGGWFARIPFQIYLPDARTIDRGFAKTKPVLLPLSMREEDRAAVDHVVVREIAFIIVGKRLDNGIVPPRIPPSFRLIERRVTAGYAYLRYRRADPIVVTPRALASDLYGGSDIAILLQPARS